MDIKSGELNPETKYDIKINEGKFKAQVDYASEFVAGKIEVSVGVDQIIDAIAAKIPGTIDDAIFSVLKEALKK